MQLLAAARQRFKTRSYEDVTVRDIASDAGVDASLISRYFGGKEGLYREMVAALGDGLVFVGRPRAEFGAILARAALNPSPGDALSDGFMIILRAVGSLLAVGIIREAVEAWNQALCRWIDQPDAEQRAALIRGAVLGAVVDNDLRGGFEAEATRRAVETRLARTLQSYLDAA